MDATPITLLERLRRPDDQAAWSQFVRLYTPMLYSWACRAGLTETDAADLLQDVFTTLFQELPTFHYQPTKSFRGWMRTILLNRWRTLQRRRRPLSLPADRLESLPADDLPLPAEDEERRQLMAQALVLLEAEVAPATWQAFQLSVIDGQTPKQVAEKLGITLNAVYLARSRILKRLRDQLEGLLE